MAMRRLSLDRVWWVVSPGNPLKDHSNLAPLQERMRAAARCADHPRIDVTGVEKLWRIHHSAAFLQRIRNRRAGVHFIWLMGADGLAELHRWRNWKRLVSTLPVAVVSRPGWLAAPLFARASQSLADARLPEVRAGALWKHRPPVWIWLDGPRSPLSSTSLRQPHGNSLPVRS